MNTEKDIIDFLDKKPKSSLGNDKIIVAMLSTVLGLFLFGMVYSFFIVRLFPMDVIGTISRFIAYVPPYIALLLLFRYLYSKDGSISFWKSMGIGVGTLFITMLLQTVYMLVFTEVPAKYLFTYMKIVYLLFGFIASISAYIIMAKKRPILGVLFMIAVLFLAGAIFYAIILMAFSGW